MLESRSVVSAYCTLRPSAPPPYLSYCRALIVFFGVAMALVPCVVCREREREREREVAGTMMLIWLVRNQDSGVVECGQK